MMRTLALAAVAVVSFLGAPAAAQDVWVNVPPQVSECTSGVLEPQVTGSPVAVGCTTPECGCNCPVVGAGVEWQAMGQSGSGWAATSGCQSGFAAEAQTGFFDPLGVTSVDPYVWCYPGGLGDACGPSLGVADLPSL